MKNMTAPTVAAIPLTAELEKLLQMAHREGLNRFAPPWADDEWYKRTDRESAEYHAELSRWRDVCASHDAALSAAEKRARYAEEALHEIDRPINDIGNARQIARNYFAGWEAVARADPTENL